MKQSETAKEIAAAQVDIDTVKQSGAYDLVAVRQAEDIENLFNELKPIDPNTAITRLREFCDLEGVSNADYANDKARDKVIMLCKAFSICVLEKLNAHWMESGMLAPSSGDKIH